MRVILNNHISSFLSVFILSKWFVKITLIAQKMINKFFKKKTCKGGLM